MLSAARLPQVLGPKLASHYKPVENEVKVWTCPNHIRRTKSESIKKRIIVSRSVRSMFGEQTFAQLRNGLKTKRVGGGGGEAGEREGGSRGERERERVRGERERERERCTWSDQT